MTLYSVSHASNIESEIEASETSDYANVEDNDENDNIGIKNNQEFSKPKKKYEYNNFDKYEEYSEKIDDTQYLLNYLKKKVENQNNKIQYLEEKILQLEKMVSNKSNNSSNNNNSDQQSSIKDNKKDNKKTSKVEPKKDNTTNQISKNITEGIKYLQSGNIDKAKTIFIDIQNGNSKDKGKALYFLGIIYFFQEQNIPTAINFFKKSCAYFNGVMKKSKLSMNDDKIFRLAMVNLIKCLRSKGDKQDAKVILEHLLKLQKNDGKKFPEITKEIHILQNE